MTVIELQCKKKERKKTKERKKENERKKEINK